MVKLLMEHGEISFEESAVFIDGTKIEANANRYTFVWKTGSASDRRSSVKGLRKICPSCWRPRVQDHSAPRDYRAEAEEAQEEIVRREAGAEHHLRERERAPQIRLTKSNRTYRGLAGKAEALQSGYPYLRRPKQLQQDGPGRNIYAHEGRPYENGQLKPGYNVNVAVVSEFIVGNYISGTGRTQKPSFHF